MMRTQVPIDKPPPTAHETEHRFRPQLRICDVHEYQVPSGPKQFVNMLKRRAQIAYRMEHIGADDEIEFARLESLVSAGLLKIENFVFYFWKAGELLLGAAKKCDRDVTEDVRMQSAIDQRQHVRRQSTRSGPDFQDSQPTALWQVTGGLLHGCRDRREPVARVEALAIKLVQ